MVCLTLCILTLKVPITTAADDIHIYFFIVFPEKIRLDVSCESSTRQRIHMKHQALFSLKDKSEKLKCHLLQFLSSALKGYCTVFYHALKSLVITAIVLSERMSKTARKNTKGLNSYKEF